MMMYMYVVQRCWLDGPKYEPAVDCQRLWTSLEAAQQFAHGSAVKYSEAVAANNSTNNNKRPPKPVRTVLLNSNMFGFATSGRLFWVRRVSMPVCECLLPHSSHPIPATTALVRMHQGVLGASSSNNNHHGRRGTEDVENFGRLDCPNSCLQTWLQVQLATYQACTWKRIPVGNTLVHNNEWWKEWSDFASWGKSATTSTAESSSCHGEVVMMQENNSNKRGWIEQDDDDDVDDELMGDSYGTSSGGGDENAAAAGANGFLFFSNCPNKKRVQETEEARSEPVAVRFMN